MQKTIISFYDFTGNWSQPYEDAGYHVIRVDLKRGGGDVRLFRHIDNGDEGIHGILIAPPCTAFAGSGAQYWKQKDQNGETLQGLALVDAALRAVALYQNTLAFWVLENPVGRLRHWLGPPRQIFNPCDYGGYGDKRDAYTKRTCLWGNFNVPRKKPVEPIRVSSQGSWVQKLGGKSERTKELRSATPHGFARAFFEANP